MRRPSGRALRSSVCGLSLFALAPGCAPSVASEAALVDVTAELGLPLADRGWPDGTYFLPEIMQGGVGVFDADGDGVLDLWHVRVPPPRAPEARITNRLYRRSRAQHEERFRDVSVEAGLTQAGFGQALAVGDTDNDGALDVFVANYGPDVFYRNLGDGRFVDATQAAGLVEDGWTTAAAFCDSDADGLQDLFVVRYQRFDPGNQCTDASARREYCGPILGAQDSFYRNQGNGAFVDVTEEAGMLLPQRAARSTGLGVVFLDLTRDGRPDLFVANDAQANHLWVNQGDGTYLDQGVERGVALDRGGQTEANMGIAVGDVNGDGLLDLCVTHLWEENNRLYLGTQLPVFRDYTIESQLSRYDLERTGFGCGFIDFDHDGDRDLAVVNGAVHRRPPLAGAPAGFWADYAEPNQLFENDGNAGFVLCDEKAGTFAAEIEVSRGLAFGDLDEDGDLDLVVSNVDNSLRVYRNDAPAPGSHWLMVRALTRGRDALGAQIRVRAGAREFLGLALAASSYGSSHDPRAHFGLGSLEHIDAIVVDWPDGVRECFPGTAVDRVVILRQGEGNSC